MEPVAGVLALGVLGPTRGPWTPPGDGSGPAWASSPGRVAGGLHVTRQVGTAVSAVWQCHLAVTAVAWEARTVPPHASVYLQVGTAPGAGEGCSPPAPTLGADSSCGGTRGPATATSLRAGHRRSPTSRTESLCPGWPPLLPLGRRPKPSRNRTRPGSAFESPQEGSAELPKADETPPSAPLKHFSACATLGAVLTLWGYPHLPLLAGRACRHPVPQFPHP